MPSDLEITLIGPEHAAEIAARLLARRQEGVTKAEVRAWCEDCNVYGAVTSTGTLAAFLAFVPNETAIRGVLEERIHLFVAPRFTGFRVAEQLLHTAVAHRLGFAYEASFRTHWLADLREASLTIRRELLRFGFTLERRSCRSWLTWKLLPLASRCEFTESAIDEAMLELHLFLTKRASVQTPFGEVTFR